MAAAQVKQIERLRRLLKLAIRTKRRWQLAYEAQRATNLDLREQVVFQKKRADDAEKWLRETSRSLVWL